MKTVVPEQPVLRPELEALPDRMRSLPLDARGYPTPWFVAWVDGQPEFRCADGAKFKRAIREKRCWVCGEPLGRFLTFIVGPMCGINHTSGDPPCHLECATYSVHNCPFLNKPHMHRRENDLPENTEVAGFMIRRNPGVSLLWTTRRYRLFDDGRGGILFDIGEPESVAWYAEGRAATRAEIEESVRTGLPTLEALAGQEAGALAELERRKLALERLYP